MAGAASQLTIGSLFSGIGGLELGLERAGLGPVRWQVEIDPFARQVLARHWPEAVRYEDVRTVGPELAPVDILCGGFPCQDISVAGKGAGLDGERSGLWSEFARIVRLVRPRFILVENVAALLARGMERVLGDLAACGYDAEWDCVPASAVGAPHQRDRIFVLAWHVPDAERDGGRQQPERDLRGQTERWHAHIAHVRAAVAHPDAAERRPHIAGGLDGDWARAPESRRRGGNCLEAVDDAGRVGLGDAAGRRHAEPRAESGAGADGVAGDGAWPPGPDDLHAWAAVPPLSQPSFCRLADGLPELMVRSRTPALEGFGNAVSPAVAEVVGRRLKEIADGRSLPIVGDGEQAEGEG